MAIEANTYLTFTAIGNREDLSDMIHDVSPTERPFMANAKTTAATAVTHEWQTDVLAAAANNKRLRATDTCRQARIVKQRGFIKAHGITCR